MELGSESVPIPQLKQIQRCPNCRRQLVLTEAGKCQECGEEINNIENESKNIS